MLHSVRTNKFPSLLYIIIILCIVANFVFKIASVSTAFRPDARWHILQMEWEAGFFEISNIAKAKTQSIKLNKH